ncbi:MAG: tRNA (adenosine(37)-N6)-dimethylallyltransferase [Solirubrobacterales bacterium]
MVALAGPTGVGKTGVGVELGSLLADQGEQAVAINCDSMQVYRGISTLTGGPTEADQRRLEHRLVGFVPLDQEFSVGDFARRAHVEIDSALAAGIWPILVGGSGLYLRAALTELDLRPQVPGEIEKAVAAELGEVGPEALHSQLPEPYSEWVHPRDRKRVSRYLGLLRAGEEPAPPSGAGGDLWSASMRKRTVLFGLTCSPEELRTRIERRVEVMAEAGATDEARKVLEGGASRTAAKAVGIAEFAAGDLDSVVKRHLALARRQETWIRRDENVIRLDRTDMGDREVARMVLAAISESSGGQA